MMDCTELRRNERVADFEAVRKNHSVIAFCFVKRPPPQRPIPHRSSDLWFFMKVRPLAHSLFGEQGRQTREREPGITVKRNHFL